MSVSSARFLLEHSFAVGYFRKSLAPLTPQVCASVRRDLCIWQKRPVNTSVPQVCVSVKRDLFMWQKRPVNTSVPQVSVSVKRNLFMWQKRPIDTSIPQVCVSKCQKRPAHMAKEAC